jgi:mRNA deadenylase 3'-5' endonuclease subunit Ccr4
MIASTTKNNNRNISSRMQGWTGRVVARLLPPDGEADFDYTLKDRVHRIPPRELDTSTGSAILINTNKYTPLTNPSQFGKDSEIALSTDDVRWTTLDVILTKEGCEEQHVHMNRASQETVTNALNRMELSIAKRLEHTLSSDEIKAIKKSQRQNKTSKQELVTTKQIVMRPSSDNENSSVEWNVDDMTNGEFWKQVATDYAPGDVSITVSVYDSTVPVTIDSCPPTVIAVRAFHHFEGRVFVGIPLVIDLDLLFATHAIVDWYVGGEKVCSDNDMYVPTKDDIGKQVAVLIRPIRPGHDGADYQEAYTFQHTVEERPHNAIFPLRQEWTAKRDRSKDDTLRVMSFNVLAHEKAFMDSREDNTGLYPYCDDDLIKRSRRTPLLLHEILAYQADVICLQEVDETSFVNLYQPALRVHGYQGYYRMKMGTREGIAMFWDTRHTFEEASEKDMMSFSIQGLFPKDKNDILEDWKSMHDVYDFLEEDEDLKTVLTKKLGHVVQIASLTRKNTSSGPKKLVVSNTHLFFHSKGHHIRLLQLFAICHKLEKERQGYPILFCGDFNTTPHSGGVRLLLDKHVPRTHHTAWKHYDTFSWEDEGHEGIRDDDITCEPPSVRLPDSFPVLCSGYEEFPIFTHYIADFCGTLDYILMSQASPIQEYGLVATACAPMPTKEEIEKHTAMPSVEWPSDHVSLVCDMEFQRANKQ